ncbi:hypothetical protein FHR75_003272 [Kineococcus radiotolerans]|uniref:DUF4253 domain-containing protein n=2 Tax=Kineococcus radiotolerans TaxID=131568 RepID=A6WFG9_KINRD|nr:DUF4253 domain-containing protein [Kineococcus radiotolerans]ABS05558.1 conserved hypothetical protein [Kineococcus radiotolerans SRS30216 = ATCC BAA-149]MBB2902441.1 hypothetical protein [Kineococcus radiotolerans]
MTDAHAPLADLVAAVPGLPTGRLVAPAGYGGAEPLLWVADVPAGRGRWAELAAAHPATGLWPVLLEGLAEGDLARPWLEGEFAPAPWAPLDVPALEPLLAEAFAGAFEDEDEFPAGPPPWPGPSPALTPVADPAAVAAVLADELVDHGAPRHLGLVPAARGADVLAVLGWLGATNHDTAPGVLSSVLRSWEDRFGVRLVALGFDTVVVSVAAPPADAAEALPVAAEHLGFCYDAVFQDGPGDLAAYAAELVGTGAWRFWWD